MHAANHRDRCSGIDRPNVRDRKVQTDIHLAPPHGFVHQRGVRHFDVADIGEALGAQQFVRGILWRKAQGRHLRKANSSRFKGPFRGLYSWCPNKARGTGP